jgi:predicted nuclease of predicted toxin-antitoxin system
VKFLLDHDVPDDLTYLLQELGHEVLRLRDVAPPDAVDSVVLQFAHAHSCLLVTCNRDDFIELAERQPHHGIVVIVRRKTRAAERAALFRLLERAGDTGLQGNINFA